MVFRVLGMISGLCWVTSFVLLVIDMATSMTRPTLDPDLRLLSASMWCLVAAMGFFVSAISRSVWKMLQEDA